MFKRPQCVFLEYLSVLSPDCEFEDAGFVEKSGISIVEEVPSNIKPGKP